MLLSSCTSALGRPFLFPSAGSSHTGLCLLLFSGPGVLLTGSWGCPCLGVRPLGSPDEDSFPSLGPLGLSMPEVSGSHPPSSGGRVAPGHPREGGGGQQTGTEVGVFPPMLCYMAIPPAVRQGPVRLGWGGLEGSGQLSPSSCPPHSDEVEENTQQRRREMHMKRNPGYFHLIPSLQIAPLLSSPALICSLYHEALLQLLVKHSRNMRNSHER